jgi:hypothetical protein
MFGLRLGRNHFHKTTPRQVKILFNYGGLFIRLMVGPNFLRCTKVFSQRHPFLSFLPCKDTFMDDYDGIYNCNGLKYSPSKKFDNF